MNKILNNLEWRYAVKKFDSDQILSEDEIDKLKHAFNLTATSYGLQPIKLVVLQNKELQAQLVKHSFGQQQVAQASHVLIICIENKIDSDYIANYFDRIKKVRGTDEAILNPFKQAMMDEFSQKDSVQLLQWAKNQAYLAMGNLLTFCAMAKIDACPMEGFDPRSYDKLLGLDGYNVSSVLVMPIGHRASDDMFSGFKKVRKQLDDSIIEINS